jgi:hypothetical protein
LRRTTAQLVNGVLLCREGDSTGARLLLSKALKQAHGLVGSTQLVGQVLNALAPVQQERQDVAGAQKMFESATTLLKSIGDLPSLVTTLKGLCALHHATGDAGKSGQAATSLPAASAVGTRNHCGFLPHVCTRMRCMMMELTCLPWLCVVAGRAAKGEEYLRRKQAELAGRVAEALDAPKHTALLKWQI